MKNKLLLCISHLAITIIAAIFLVTSIKWFMSNISYQNKTLKEKAQTLQNEINAPNYFKSQGITIVTPQVITNYDQQFGTDLRSKITWQISHKNTIKSEIHKKKVDYFNETTGANKPTSYQSQSPVAYMHSPEAKSSVKWSSSQQATKFQPTAIPSQINQAISLSMLEESISESSAELETLQNKGVWNYILSLNIIIPGTSMSLTGLFFITMLKKIFEDCYPGIKIIAKQIWSLFFYKKNIIQKKNKKK